ncbi:MAG: MarR family transcriptional regulator [Actinomycetota bacterium]|nr:MarR family transcriptional regulator [Actinomycetota bacterium]
MTDEPSTPARPISAGSGLDISRMAAWRGFIEAHSRVLERLSKELLDEVELPMTWYDVLVQLSEADEHRLRMQDLADRVLLSQSGVTRLVDRMVRAGLVARERCTEDGRGMFALLTDQGLETLRRTYPTHLRGVQQWFADVLTTEETEVLARALSRVADNARPPAGSEEADRAGG